MPYFNIDDVNNYVCKIFMNYGLSEEDSQIVTDNLIFADLRGVSSHGLIRVSNYIKRLEKGTVNSNPRIRQILKRPALLVLDADGGMGQVAANEALNQAIEIAQVQGAGTVFVRNSNHFGMASYFTRKAAEKGMIAIAFSNAPPAMAPWGGAEPALGTNPMSFAFPNPEGEPIIIDMATSTVARGKIREAAKLGKSIPSNWAIDRQGEPTVDPHEALDGSLSPFGGVKGYCLSIVVEMFAGLFAGAGFSKDLEQAVGGTEGHLKLEQRVGHSFIVINSEDLLTKSELLPKMKLFQSYIKGSTRARGVEEIFVPGEIEASIEAKNRQRGLLISEQTFLELNKIGCELSIENDLKAL